MKNLNKIILLVFVSIFLISGCSSNKTSNSTEITTEYAPSSVEYYYDEYSTDRKVTQNYSIQLVSEKVEDSANQIKTLVSEYKGYIAYSSENATTEYYRYTVKIPTEKNEEFLEALKKTGDITNVNLYTDDITETYDNTTSKLTALKTQEARLLEFMSEAESVSDLIAIEEKLMQVQRDIEYYTNEVNRMDSRVNYTDFEITISAKYTEKVSKNFMGEIGYSIKDSFYVFTVFIQNILIAIIYLIPFLIAATIIIYLIIKLRKVIKPREKNIWTKKE